MKLLMEVHHLISFKLMSLVNNLVIFRSHLPAHFNDLSAKIAYYFHFCFASSSHTFSYSH